jgi:hypothetical protein
MRIQPKAISIAILAVLVISAVSALTFNSVQASSAISVDGGSSTRCGAGGTTCPTTLSTSDSNDIIYVSCLAGATAAGGSSITGVTVTATGLSFSQRAEIFSANNAVSPSIGTDYAIATGALSSVVITCSWTGTDIAGNYNFDTLAFGISGANTASPFAAVPCSASDGGTKGTSGHCSISTSDANAMIIGALVISSNQAISPGGSFSLVAGTSMTGGPSSLNEYLVVSSIQSALSVGASWSTSSGWAVIGDAIDAGTATSTSSGSTSSTSSTSTTSSGLALDRSTSVVSFGVSSITTSITTTHSEDVVVLYVSTGQYTPNGCGSLTPPPTITSVEDGAGLTWHQRSVGTTTQCEVSPGPADEGYGFQVHLEEWYAIAPTPLTSDVITITAAYVADEIQDIAFGVSGANTASPFDTTGFCVATSYNTTPGCTMSTTASDTMVVMGDAGPNGVSPSPGYTQILFSAERVQDMGAEYQTFSSPQTGILVGFTAGQDTDIAGGNDIWVVIGDTFQAA